MLVGTTQPKMHNTIVAILIKTFLNKIDTRTYSRDKTNSKFNFFFFFSNLAAAPL